MKEFLRLLRYAAPYRAQLTAALLAMVVYAAGSALLVYLLKPILDKVLIAQQQVRQVAILLLVNTVATTLYPSLIGLGMTALGALVYVAVLRGRAAPLDEA